MEFDKLYAELCRELSENKENLSQVLEVIRKTSENEIIQKLLSSYPFLTHFYLSRMKILSSTPGKFSDFDDGAGKNKGAHCLEEVLKNEKSLDNFLELYGGKSESNGLEMASSAIELKFNENKGRHLVATQKIPPGAVLIVDKAYSSTLFPSNYKNFCTYCCKRINESDGENVINCPTCSDVLFCSAQCAQRALSSYHSTECKILKFLNSSSQLGQMSLLAFRTVLSTKNLIYSAFKKAHSANDGHQNDCELIKKGFKILEDEKDEENFSSVFSMITNFKNRSGGDILKRLLISLYLTLSLRFIDFKLENDKDQNLKIFQNTNSGNEKGNDGTKSTYENEGRDIFNK